MNPANRSNNMKQAALRCGVALMVLSSACALQAQAREVADSTSTASASNKVSSRRQLPQYQMKEVTGVVYDAATRQPLPGVRVQSLGNKLYSALTDEKGAYKISVPEHVTSLYISTDGYNAVQVGLHTGVSADAYLYDSKFASLYHDGTTILNKAKYMPNESSSISPETDIENQLNARSAHHQPQWSSCTGCRNVRQRSQFTQCQCSTARGCRWSDLGHAVRTYHFARRFL